MFTVVKFDRNSFGDNTLQESHAGRYGVIPVAAEQAGGFGYPDPNAVLILTTDKTYAQKFATSMIKAAHDFFKEIGDPPDNIADEPDMPPEEVYFDFLDTYCKNSTDEEKLKELMGQYDMGDAEKPAAEVMVKRYNEYRLSVDLAEGRKEA